MVEHLPRVQLILLGAGVSDDCTPRSRDVDIDIPGTLLDIIQTVFVLHRHELGGHCHQRRALRAQRQHIESGAVLACTAHTLHFRRNIPLGGEQHSDLLILSTNKDFKSINPTALKSAGPICSSAPSSSETRNCVIAAASLSLTKPSGFENCLPKGTEQLPQHAST